MSKITIQKDSTLLVPDVPTVPYITGDGVGAEVTPSMQIIVDAAVRKAYGGKRHIEWLEVPAGERAFNETGSWLPEETMQAFQEYLVGIKGPLTTPVGGGIRSLNVALRQTLDLYVCLRPVRWYQGVQSPVKAPEKVNMCVFRGDVKTAISANPSLVIVLPLLGAVLISVYVKNSWDIKKRWTLWCLYLSLFFLLSFGILRNLPFLIDLFGKIIHI